MFNVDRYLARLDMLKEYMEFNINYPPKTGYALLDYWGVPHNTKREFYLMCHLTFSQYVKACESQRC